MKSRTFPSYGAAQTRFLGRIPPGGKAEYDFVSRLLAGKSGQELGADILRMAWETASMEPDLSPETHEALAYLIVALALWQAVSMSRTADDPHVRRSTIWLGFAVVAQLALGIWTLLAWVPLSLGVAHQAGALVVLATALWHLFAVRRVVANVGHGTNQ